MLLYLGSPFKLSLFSVEALCLPPISSDFIIRSSSKLFLELVSFACLGISFADYLSFIAFAVLGLIMSFALLYLNLNIIFSNNLLLLSSNCTVRYQVDCFLNFLHSVASHLGQGVVGAYGVRIKDRCRLVVQLARVLQLLATLECLQFQLQFGFWHFVYNGFEGMQLVCTFSVYHRLSASIWHAWTQHCWELGQSYSWLWTVRRLIHKTNRVCIAWQVNLVSVLDNRRLGLQHIDSRPVEPNWSTSRCRTKRKLCSWEVVVDVLFLVYGNRLWNFS